MKLFDVYPLYNIEPVKAEGCYVWDNEGNQYLDLYGGHAVISIGHRHPYFVNKIKKQMDKICFYSNSIINSLQRELAEKLSEISGYSDYNLFLCNSGAEANENALKLASFHNGKTKLIAFKGAFHGRTAGALSITDNPSIRSPINTSEHVAFLELEDVEELEKNLKTGEICAVITEGIQGINGIDSPSHEFLQAIDQLCHQYNAVFIVDEIQSGYGRTGKFFAHQHSNVQPDLITVAKGMGNGFPVGGVLIHPKFKAKYGLLGTTFGGNHLACVAAIAVLEVLEKEHLIQNAITIGKYFNNRLKGLPGVKNVKGKGLMIGVEFDFLINDLRRQLIMEARVFTGSSTKKNVLRLLPPLNISKTEVDVFIVKLNKMLEKTATKKTICIN